MEVFMDDFSVFGNSFGTCLSHLDKMLKRCEDTNLCLNWEKSNFMVKEGIVLDHKISKNGIEVDKAKVDVITKLPHPTTVKDLLRACPHHGFTKLHQLDTFYNALNLANQDSLNSAVGGNLLERRTQDVLMIIENKSKVRNSQNKSIVSQVKSSNTNSSSSFGIAKLTHAVNQQTSAVTTTMTPILKQFQANPPSAFVKAIEEICVTCGGAHPYYQCLAADGNTFLELRDNIQGSVSAAVVNYNH
nr:reverse transcriptase domain-containing protein [Tanacetum cinerariifolium]